MTKEEFKNLKVRDTVYIPDKNKPGKYFSTQVLKIDRYFNKVTVFFCKKPFSYKYPRKNIEPNRCSFMVGLL